MLRIGYNSNGFPHHRLEEAVPWLAELGYGAVALTPDVGHLDPRSAAPAQVEAFGRLCAQHGLTVVLETGARFILDPRRKHRPNLLERDESWRQRLGFLLQMLDWCEILGCGVLSFWSGALPSGQSRKGAVDRFREALDALQPQAERRRVELALEPEPGHWIGTLDDFTLHAPALRGRLRLTMDVGHCLVEGRHTPDAAIREFAGEIANLQLDDMRRARHRHLAPGEGELDWPALATAIREAPIRDGTPACFELSRDGHRFDELAPQVIAFARRLGL